MIPWIWLIFPFWGVPFSHMVKSLNWTYFLTCFVPYFDRRCILPSTPEVSSAPRIRWYRTPGRSFTLPPLIKTIECSWRLCPSPGIYAFTSFWLVNLTLATLRMAEFGFLGVVVYTRTHTPLRCGHELSAGALLFSICRFLPFRTNCWIVGIYYIRFFVYKPPFIKSVRKGILFFRKQ